MREVIREELGEYPETLWRKFDPEAIASASLAQVHRAESWDGEQLAVKVCMLMIRMQAHEVYYRSAAATSRKIRWCQTAVVFLCVSYVITVCASGGVIVSHHRGGPGGEGERR